MRHIKACSVFDEDLLTRQSHSRDKVTNSTERPKARHQNALAIVKDLIAACDIMDVRNKENEDESLECNQCAEDDSIDDKRITFISIEEEEVIEQHLFLTASLRGRDIAHRETRIIDATFLDTTKNNILFGLLGIDSCGSRTSVICDAQYEVYCRTFNLPYSI